MWTYMKMMKMMKMARRWHEDRTIGLSVYRQAQAHCCEERCQPQASPGQSCSASLRNSLSFRCRFVVVVCCVLCVANGYCYKNEPRRKKTDTGSEKLQRTSGEKVRDGTNMEKTRVRRGWNNSHQAGEITLGSTWLWQTVQYFVLVLNNVSLIS